MKHSWYLILGGGILISLLAITLSLGRARTTTPIATNNPKLEATYALPTDDFLDRVTKKPFGIFIDPKTSPVQPEKFRGYHTAADAEYGDIEGVVEVHAIADGKVVVSRTATGYGGVIVINHRPAHDFFSLYGHVDPASLLPVGTEVKKGDVIAHLAPAYSAASGGERKHLHLGIINQATANIAGYVQEKSQLSGWLDPVALLKS